MGNPYSDTALQNESVQNIMSRIWHCADEAGNPNAIQLWREVSEKKTSRVLDFQINQRSGSDAWFADLLTSCREGNMNDEDYFFLHGLPTLHCGSWLTSQQHSSCGNPDCALIQEKTKNLRSKSAAKWYAEMLVSKNKYECTHCIQERKRRHRVLWGESLATRKSMQEYNKNFKEALYI